jgi:hypothetical protein|tara:strand:+ start:963 stop:1157 length:195 start_codon:yes stop_codon:yes gene_type:complete
MVKTVIGLVDSMFPGQKTYILLGMSMLMMACQGLGYHSFSAEVWGMMGIGGAATWKMGADRKKE